MKNTPLLLDFDASSGAGFKNWQLECKANADKIAKECGLPLNQKVRLKHKYVEKELVGILRLVKNPTKKIRKRTFLLCIGKFEFYNDEIEYCSMAKD